MPQLVAYNTNSKEKKTQKKTKRSPNNLNRIQIFMDVFIAYKIENVDSIDIIFVNLYFVDLFIIAKHSEF